MAKGSFAWKYEGERFQKSLRGRLCMAKGSFAWKYEGERFQKKCVLKEEQSIATGLFA